MLNAVKYLYRIVSPKQGVSQRMQDDATEMPHCAQHNRRRSLIPVFHHLALLVCLLLASSSQAQVYALKTLDGANAAITIRERAFTPFTISYSTDKLILPGYWAPGEVRILNKRFLEIRYYVRGGSNVGLGSTLLLCISHGKLRQAMHIESYYYNMEDEKITTNCTRLLLDAPNTLRATVYDTVAFNRKSRPDSIVIKKSSIKFNTTQRVFCNYQKKVTTTLISYNYKTNHFNRLHFAEVVPAFQLDGCEYIFISGRWYGKGGDNKNYSSID
jgi:hypothetical protein